MNAPAEKSRLPRSVKIVAVVFLVLLAAEALVRVRASALPPPLKWATPDLDRKVTQIGALSARGGASVLFLGSSTVDAGVDPTLLDLDQTSLSAYNAGLRGGSIAMVSHWARAIAVPRLRPAVVILGIASRELAANDDEVAERERDYFEAPAVQHIVGKETALVRAERTLEDVSSIFKYRTWIRDPRYLRALIGIGDAPSVTQTSIGDYLAPSGQFRFFLGRRYSVESAATELRSGGRITDGQVDELARLLSYLRSRVDRVIVVNMPVTDDYVATQPPGERKRFDDILKAETDKIAATYLDPGIWPHDDFADPYHVNESGSRRLTELLKQAIRTESR